MLAWPVLATKVSFALTTAVAGDLVCQTVLEFRRRWLAASQASSNESRAPLDWLDLKRVLAFAVYGSIIYGCRAIFWFNFLDWKFPISSFGTYGAMDVRTLLT